LCGREGATRAWGLRIPTSEERQKLEEFREYLKERDLLREGIFFFAEGKISLHLGSEFEYVATPDFFRSGTARERRATVFSASGDIIPSITVQVPQSIEASEPDILRQTVPHNPGPRPRTFADLPPDEQRTRRMQLGATLQARQAQSEVSWLLRPWGWGHSAAVAVVVGGLLAYSVVVDGTLALTTSSELVFGALTVLPLALALLLRARARIHATEAQTRDTAFLAQLGVERSVAEPAAHG
jgi:hypothetical protein